MAAGKGGFALNSVHPTDLLTNNLIYINKIVCFEKGVADWKLAGVPVEVLSGGSK